jgi:hypothetical protein
MIENVRMCENASNDNYSSENFEMKDGEYNLSFAQIFFLNKKLDKGYKFELFDNVNKASDSILPKHTNSKKPKFTKELSSISEEKSVQKKKKKNDICDINALSKEDSLNLNKGNDSLIHKRSLREKKPNLIKDLGYIDKDSNKASKTSLTQDVFKKCDKVFQKLKKHPLSDSFLTTSNNDVPCLSQIEKQLKAYTYTSIFQFGMDVRKVWNYYFTHSTSNTEIYQKTFTISNYFEEIFREVESNLEEKTDLHELQKKVNKLQEKFNEINQNKSLSGTNLKRERSGSNLDKPMTIAEKNMLGNNIRQLTPEQLKGIIKILNDSLSVDQSKKYFEFDIETLSNKKLRELEKYVKTCLKLNSVGGASQINDKKRPNFDENDKINQLKVA